MKRISFIVIVHKGHGTLASCLSSIEADASIEDELILVLNNPDQKTKKISQSFSKWKLVHESVQGAASARNAGVANSQGEVLCFLDADVCIPHGWSNQMIRNFKNPWIGGGQSRIVVEKKPGLLNFLKRYSTISFNCQFYQLDTKVWTFDTAALMVKRTWFDKVGGFRAEFKRLEDTDFSLRLLYQGADVFFEDRVFATEIYDPEESLIPFMMKIHHSAKYLSLLFYRHGVDFKLQITPVQQSRASKFVAKKFPFLFWLIRILNLMGTIHGVLPIESWARFYPRILPHKKSLLENYPPESRSLWRGGQEMVLELRTGLKKYQD